MSLWWFPVSFAAVGGAWIIVNSVVGRLADRRWERNMRHVERQKRRYEAWRRVGGMGD